MKVLSANAINSLRHSHAEARGALLSHLVGGCFFLAFILSRAFPQEILQTRILDWPIRLLALWLVMDRFGRYRHAKLTGWDWAHILFVGGYGVALVYAELFMTRDTGFVNYVQWINQTLNAYLFFVVVREGLTRKGFRPDIVLRWMLATFFVACLIAITQARDIAHLRMYIDNFYHQAEEEMHLQGPSAPWQARSPAVHANSLAIMLLCGLPLLFAVADYRRLKWFDWFVGALMVLTIFMTYSRIGILSLGAVGIGAIIALVVRKEFHKAAVALFAVTCLAILFVFVVYAFDITRFKVLLNPTGPVAITTSENVGWQLRQQSISHAMSLAAQYPVFGLQAASGALNQQDVYVKNAFTYQGLLLDVYFFSFVSYGVIGVAYIAALFWMILGQVRNLRSKQAFAAATFIAGVGLLVAGIAENVLFYDQAMITMNILMAFCVMRVSRSALPEMGNPMLQNMRVQALAEAS